MVIYDLSQNMKVKAQTKFENRVILSLDWNCRRFFNDSRQLVVSDSQGCVTICDLNFDNGTISVQEIIGQVSH